MSNRNKSFQKRDKKRNKHQQHDSYVSCKKSKFGKTQMNSGIAFGGAKNILLELNHKGLWIHSIIPDGNCLFRSCADQLFGDQQRFREVRRNAVSYMSSHKDDYILFMDQSREPFDNYVRRMGQNSTWGGDLEINAISNYYKSNVIVYQDCRPNLELQNYPSAGLVLQLAYFGSCHYDSVRGKSIVTLSKESSQGNIVLRPDDIKPKKVEKPVEKPTIRLPLTRSSSKKAIKEQKHIIVIPKRTLVEVSTKFAHERIIEQNTKLLQIMESQFQKQQPEHQSCSKEWCGDIPFSQLVTEKQKDKLMGLHSMSQLKKTVKFLTMKCSCNSGSYFKYCCLPRMKICMCRKRYYLNKFRV